MRSVEFVRLVHRPLHFMGMVLVGLGALGLLWGCSSERAQTEIGPADLAVTKGIAGDVLEVVSPTGVVRWSTTLTAPGGAAHLLWSPDRQSIAFLKDYDQDQTGLSAVSLKTGREHAVLPIPDIPGVVPTAFNWSPDSHRLAVIDNLHSAITLMTLSGRRVRSLPLVGVATDWVDWLAKSKLVVIASRVRGTQSVFLEEVDANRRKPHLLARLGNRLSDVDFISLSGDRRVVCWWNRSTRTAWTMRADRLRRRTVGAFAAVSGLACNRDGERLLVWTRTGLYLARPGTRPHIIESLSDTRTIYDVDWAPDGKRFAYFTQVSWQEGANLDVKSDDSVWISGIRTASQRRLLHATNSWFQLDW